MMVEPLDNIVNLKHLKLSLNNYNVGDLGMFELSKSLGRLTLLEELTLKLAENSFGADGVKHFFDNTFIKLN